MKPWRGFDAEKDAEALRSAMKGFGKQTHMILFNTDFCIKTVSGDYKTRSAKTCFYTILIMFTFVQPQETR